MKEFLTYAAVTVWKQKAPPVGTDGAKLKTPSKIFLSEGE